MIIHYKGEGYDFWYNYKTSNQNTSVIRLVLEDILTISRCTIQKQWYKLFPKKEVTRDEMCNVFCHLPDKINIYVESHESKTIHPFEILGFIDSQIKIKENGN